MTKKRFKQFSVKCPWYYHDGKPRCRAQQKICNKKGCAVFYWVDVAFSVIDLEELLEIE